MTSGFSVVDFMNLPRDERRIMRMVMREITMTYPQLRDAIATLPAEQTMDEHQLTDTLDHLTRAHWLTRQSSGQQPAYRVNAMQRASRQNSAFWDKLELDSIDQPWSLELRPQPTETSFSPKSGGKRTLPSHVWDCLVDDGVSTEQ